MSPMQHSDPSRSASISATPRARARPWRLPPATAAAALCALCASGCFRDPDSVRAEFQAARDRNDATSDAGTALGPIECDDGNPCTQDSVVVSSCLHLPVEPTSCADAAPCLWQPRCASGVCAGKPRLYATSITLSGDRDDATDVWELAEGRLLAVGHAPAKALSGNHRRPFSLHLHGDGSPVDAATVIGVGWLDHGGKEEVDANITVNAMAPLPKAEGGPAFACVGDITKLGPQEPMRGFVRRFGTNGQVTSHQELPLPGGHTLRAVASATSTALLAVGWRDQSASDAPDVSGIVCRVYSDGVLHTCLTLGADAATGGATMAHGRLHGVTALSGGKERWVAVGTRAPTQTFTFPHDGGTQSNTGVGDAAGAWIAAVAGPIPAVQWQVLVPPPEGWKVGAARDVHALDEATVAVMATVGIANTTSDQGWQAPYGPEGRLWLLKVRATDGKVLAQMVHRLLGGPQSSGLGVDAAGQPLLAVAQAAPGPSDPPRLWFFGPDLAARGHKPIPTLTAWRVRQLANSDWLLAGTRQIGDLGADSTLVRLDATGGSLCKEGGKCPVAGIAGCADDNPCTLDACDAEQGCTHSAQPDGMACGGEATCEQGTCGK